MTAPFSAFEFIFGSFPAVPFVRPVIAIFVWILIIGGLWTYTHTRETVTEAETFQLRPATGKYSLEIVPTFDMQPDPFALQVDDTAKTALLVQLNGSDIIRETDRVEAGSPIRVTDIENVVEGPNEFFIEAGPPLEQSNRAHAIRVRLKRGDSTVVDETVWSEPGNRIAATVPFTAEKAESPARDSHDR